jgi:tetratricopeptide (TPR) repeat protein/tRNA A-37 threonylcarbamoyl transferase component Bud32
MNERDLLIETRPIPDPAERATMLEPARAGDADLRRRAELLLQAETAARANRKETAPPDAATALEVASAADAASTLAPPEEPAKAAATAMEVPASAQPASTPPLVDGPGEPSLPAAEFAFPHGQQETLDRAEELAQTLSGKTKLLSSEEGFDLEFTIAGSIGPRFHPPEMPGLSQFELLAELGRGGMGVVYKARHRALNRVVALKMILDGKHAHSDHRERFRIEAEAVARLHHPNIVQLYDLGEADGCPFVTLEMLEGGSLADRLKGTTQTGRAAAELVAALATAMHAAHQAGIVHRDLKPANVLFERDGTPKITDFGLAKRLEVEEARTQSGQVMGTPSYMAPEQAQGHVHKIGPPADIYALGAILYEMLTGRPPFKAPTMMEILYQVVYEDAVPPSRLQPRIARDLETICLKCLQKDPQKRYGTALELADDLHRYLDDRPIRARRTPLWERTVKWVRRYPTRAALLVTAALVLIAALAAGRSLDARNKSAARIEEQRVVDLAVRGDHELFKAQGLCAQKEWAQAKFILTPLLVVLKPESRLKTLTSRVSDLLVQADRGIEEEKHQQEDQHRLGVFLQRRDQAFYLETRYSGLDLPTNTQMTRAAAREALAVFAQPGPGPGQEDAWSLPPLRATLSPHDRAEITEGCYELLLILAGAVAEPLPGEEPKQQAALGLHVLDQAARLRPESARAFHVRRADRLTRAGDSEGAKRERQEADRFGPTTAADYFLAGKERYDRGDWSGAEADFEAVLRLQRDHFWAQCLSAICLLQTKRPAEAKVGLKDCLKREPGFVWLYLLHGFASGQVAAQAMEAAKAYPARAGDYQRGAESQFAAAEADYLTALKLLDDRSKDHLRGKTDDQLRYILLVNRGQMRFQHGRLDEAVADLRDAIARNDRQYEAFSGLGSVYLRQKKWDQAHEQLTQAIQLKPGYPPLYRERARVHQYRDDPTPEQRAEALGDLDQAIAHEAPDHLILASDQTRRGELLRRLHRGDEALAACDAALKLDPGHDDALRLRVLVLLDLKRFNEAIRGCDDALAEGKPWPELYELRGLARAGRQDFSGAIADYTLALEHRPGRGQPRVLISRGLTYVVSDAPRLALTDFAAALRLDPSSGEAHAGRGTALVRLGDYRAAVAAAEESLRHPPAKALRAYNAARIYAEAAGAAAADLRRQGREVVLVVSKYQDRAVELAIEALRQTPAASRAEFWRSQIQADPALRSLSRRLKFAAVAAPLSNE